MSHTVWWMERSKSSKLRRHPRRLAFEDRIHSRVDERGELTRCPVVRGYWELRRFHTPIGMGISGTRLSSLCSDVGCL